LERKKLADRNQSSRTSPSRSPLVISWSACRLRVAPRRVSPLRPRCGLSAARRLARPLSASRWPQSPPQTGWLRTRWMSDFRAMPGQRQHPLRPHPGGARSPRPAGAAVTQDRRAERPRPLVFGLVALASILIAWAVIDRWLRLLMAMKSLDPSRATHMHRYSLDLLCRIGE
jgi:hypothetical protein